MYTVLSTSLLPLLSDLAHYTLPLPLGSSHSGFLAPLGKCQAHTCPKGCMSGFLLPLMLCPSFGLVRFGLAYSLTFFKSLLSVTFSMRPDLTTCGIINTFGLCFQCLVQSSENLCNFLSDKGSRNIFCSNIWLLIPVPDKRASKSLGLSEVRRVAVC